MTMNNTTSGKCQKVPSSEVIPLFSTNSPIVLKEYINSFILGYCLSHHLITVFKIPFINKSSLDAIMVKDI